MTDTSDFHVQSVTRLGTVVRGKYRLDSVIGVGGMAVVFAATHRNQKRFAVKMLHAELSVYADLRSRFLNEGYAANSLNHPGAVVVLDDDIAEDGSAFLVMELLDGIDFYDLAERYGDRLPVDAVLAAADQVLDVLAAAHDKAIVHRDIKPPNLFLTGDGTLKVLDFGIARVRDAFASAAHKPGMGAILGTPGFMAPEQAKARSNEIDGQTDLWAVGATLFKLLTGELVHQGESAAELLVCGATMPARALSSVMPDIQPEVAEIVDRALAFDKVLRWPSAVVMRDAVRSAYATIYGEPISRAPLLRLIVGRQNIAPPYGSMSHDALTHAEGDPGCEAVELPAPPVVPRHVPETFRALPADLPDGRSASTVLVRSSGEFVLEPRGLPKRLRVDRAVVAVVGVAILLSATFVLRGSSPEAVGATPPTTTSVQLAMSSSPPPPTVVALPIPHPPPEEPPLPTASPAATIARHPPPPTPAPPPPGPSPVPAAAVAARSNAPLAPCKLVETLDKAGESHFSCPCAKCR